MNLFVEHVKMPSTEQEWINETKGFIENNEFPRIGAWDGFHVYLCLKLKKKNTTTLTIDIQLGLVGYNKHFLNLTVGAPGSTHGSRFLRKVFKF